MEQKKEDSVATWNIGRRSSGNRPHRWHRHPRHDHWHPCVCGEEGECLEMHTLATAADWTGCPDYTRAWNPRQCLNLIVVSQLVGYLLWFEKQLLVEPRTGLLLLLDCSAVFYMVTC